MIAAAVRDVFPDGARIGVFYVNDDYGRGLRTAVLARLDSAAYPVIVDWPHTDEEQSPGATVEGPVGALARVLRATGPQVLLLLGRSGTVERYLPAIREALPKALLLGGDALGPGYFRVADVPDWAGVRYVDFLDLDGSEALREFRRRFEERYGTPARSAEVLVYDAMRLILTGIADGVRNGPALRAWLYTLGESRPPFPGLSGPIRFDAAGEVDRPYVLVTIPALP